MAGEVASTVLSRMAVPVLYYISQKRNQLPQLHPHSPQNIADGEAPQYEVTQWPSLRRTIMTIERALRLIAGLFVLVSLALGHWVNQYWYLFTAFVGLNLFQSGFTNWCPMMTFLRKLGVGSQEKLKHA
jgi:hypothetical protein